MSHLLPYFKLPCDNLSQIQSEVLEYVYSIDLVNTHKTQWNTVSTIDLLKHSPSVLKYCKSLGLAPQEASIVILDKDFPLHVDVPPVIAKVNFPLANCNKSNNYWIDIDQDELKKLPTKTNVHGQQTPDFSNTTEDWLAKWKVHKLDVFDCPIVFNSAIPHGVDYNGREPRLMLSMTFVKDPVSYLCKD